MSLSSGDDESPLFIVCLLPNYNLNEYINSYCKNTTVKLYKISVL